MPSRITLILSLYASFLTIAAQQDTINTTTKIEISYFTYCHFEQGEYDIEILSCNRCLNSTSNLCSLYIQNNSTNTQNLSLLAVLDPTWYHSDLLQLITTNDILTNLDDLGLLNGISSQLFTIQLNNMDIEEIRPGAFERFYSLKILNLAENKIKNIELASFSYLAFPQSLNESANKTEESSLSLKPNRLISIDLSFNLINVIRLESQAVLKELRAFNLSNNFVDSFDLRFFAIIAPKLQMLDLSSNRLKSFKVFNDYLSNGVNEDSNKPYSLLKTLIASEMIGLNLEDNNLSNFEELFSIEKEAVTDDQFCSIKKYSKNFKANFYLKTIQKRQQQRQRSNLDINIKRNAWLCDCTSYEIISTLLSQGQSLDNTTKLLNTQINKYSKSCYLSYLFNFNSYLFKSFISNIEPLSDLKCQNNQQQKNIWHSWYTTNCPNQIVTTVWNLPPTVPTTFTQAYPTNSTDSSLLNKYTISNSFYWIASVCISLITLSCVFVAWFYCWKRYTLSRRVFLLQRSRQSAPNNSSTSRRQNHRNHRSHTNSNTNTAYILNSRMVAAAGLPNLTNSEPTTSQLESNEIYQRRNGLPSLNLRQANHRINSNPNGLYYIPVNAHLGGFNPSNTGIRFQAHVNNFPLVDSTQFYENGAYMVSEHDEDPPNYYDCLLTKNRLANQVTTQNNKLTQNKRLSVVSSTTSNSIQISNSESNGSSSDETGNRTEYDMNESIRDEAEVEVSVIEVEEDGEAQSSSSRNSVDFDVEIDGGEHIEVDVRDVDNEATLNDATALSMISLARSGSNATQIGYEFSQDSLDGAHYY